MRSCPQRTTLSPDVTNFGKNFDVGFWEVVLPPAGKLGRKCGIASSIPILDLIPTRPYSPRTFVNQNSNTIGLCDGYEFACSLTAVSHYCEVESRCSPGYVPKPNSVFSGPCDTAVSGPCCGIDTECTPQPCDTQADITYAWSVGTETECFSYAKCGFPVNNELVKGNCVPPMTYKVYPESCIGLCGQGFVMDQVSYKCTVRAGESTAKITGAKEMSCIGRSCTGGVPRFAVPPSANNANTERKTGVEFVSGADGSDCSSLTTQQTCLVKCKKGYNIKVGTDGITPEVDMTTAYTVGHTGLIITPQKSHRFSNETSHVPPQCLIHRCVASHSTNM